MKRRCVVFCTFLLAAGSTLVSPVALAAGSSLTWAAPVLVDHQPPFLVNSLWGVSCPSSGLCVAVDSAGNVVISSNPTGEAAAWTVTPVDTNLLNGVSCPSGGLCVAVDQGGNVVTSSNPTGGAAAWTLTHVDHYFLYGVSCPSSVLCVAVDGSGNVVIGRASGGAASQAPPRSPAPRSPAAQSAPSSPGPRFAANPPQVAPSIGVIGSSARAQWTQALASDPQASSKSAIASAAVSVTASQRDEWIRYFQALFLIR